MVFVAYLEVLLAAPTDKARSENFAEETLNGLISRKNVRSCLHSLLGRAKSLTELQPRHLLVEEYGFRRNYGRTAGNNTSWITGIGYSVRSEDLKRSRSRPINSAKN
jgi:hypothetical protein